VHATKAAVEEGIVPGGGVALLRSIPALGKALEEKGLDHDVKVASRSPAAIEEPARWIAANAGQEAASSSPDQASKETDWGTTPRRTSSRTSPRPASSTRPSVRTAIQNASSIAA